MLRRLFLFGASSLGIGSLFLGAAEPNARIVGLYYSCFCAGALFCSLALLRISVCPCDGELDIDVLLSTYHYARIGCVAACVWIMVLAGLKPPHMHFLGFIPCVGILFSASHGNDITWCLLPSTWLSFTLLSLTIGNFVVLAHCFQIWLGDGSCPHHCFTEKEAASKVNYIVRLSLDGSGIIVILAVYLQQRRAFIVSDGQRGSHPTLAFWAADNIVTPAFVVPLNNYY